MIDDTAKEANKEKLKAFKLSSNEVSPVLIISYEQLRLHIGNLEGIQVGLLICDEGHRLKNNNIQTTKAILSLNCKRRIILSGTPIQNDMDEFYMMCSFVYPGVLSANYKEFKSEFINPILKSRDPDCTTEDKQLGEERMKEV